MKPFAMVFKFVKAGQTAARLVPYVAKKAVGLRADLGFGAMRLRRGMLPWAVAVLSAHRDACPRASEVRHLIFSAEKGMSRRAAFKALHAVFADWRDTYAPGRPWVAALQNHNGVFHLHAAVANVNSSGRPLKIRPHQVVAMADMKFTTYAVSAKGKGKKGLSIYTKARSRLAVQDLAELLAAPGGGIRADVWEQLKNKGLIGDFRERKDGSLISLLYQGKRMRLTTLEAFIGRLPATGQASGVSSGTPKKPAQPLPGSLAAKLSAAGFCSKDLARLQTNLRSANVLKPQHSTKPGTNKEQTTQPKK